MKKTIFVVGCLSLVLVGLFLSVTSVRAGWLTCEDLSGAPTACGAYVWTGTSPDDPNNGTCAWTATKPDNTTGVLPATGDSSNGSGEVLPAKNTYEGTPYRCCSGDQEDATCSGWTDTQTITPTSTSPITGTYTHTCDLSNQDDICQYMGVTQVGPLSTSTPPGTYYISCGNTSGNQCYSGTPSQAYPFPQGGVVTPATNDNNYTCDNWTQPAACSGSGSDSDSGSGSGTPTPTVDDTTGATYSWLPNTTCVNGTQQLNWWNCEYDSTLVDDSVCQKQIGDPPAFTGGACTDTDTPTADTPTANPPTANPTPLSPYSDAIKVTSEDASSHAGVSGSWEFSSYPWKDPCQGNSCSGMSGEYDNVADTGGLYTLVATTPPAAVSGYYYTADPIANNPQSLYDGWEIDYVINWQLNKDGNLSASLSATQKAGTASTFWLNGLINPADTVNPISYDLYWDCSTPSVCVSSALPAAPQGGGCSSANSVGEACTNIAPASPPVYTVPTTTTYGLNSTYLPTLVVTQNGLTTTATTTIKTGNGGVSAQAFSITPTTLPAGTIGTPYSQTLNASGTATSPFTWAVLDPSNLPPGLTLDQTVTSASNPIVGTPTATGTFTFTVSLSNAAIGTTQTYSIIVGSSNTACTSNCSGSDAIINITPTRLPPGTVGTLYDQQLNKGGTATGPFTWSVASGSLPSQLGLGATGALIFIVGTPDIVGTSNFTIGLTNGTVSTTQKYSVYIGPAGGGCSGSDCPGGGGNPPDCSMQPPSPATILVGATSTISWSCGNNPPATACTLNGQSVKPSSSMTVQPHATQLYDLSCTDDATTTASVSQVQVTVTSNPVIIEVAP